MDYLSDLPDEVLCHILSFLTTKQSALTSILSKRWLNLWTLVPNLDIDDNVFLHPEEGKREREGILESFMDFVDKALALQGDSPINKVTLKCTIGVDEDRVVLWIDNVLARGVSDLDLCISLGDRYWLSPMSFKCSKLVKLKLAGGIDLGWWTGSIFLPMLRTLFLESVEFCVDKFEMLLNACPALEELDMAYIKGLDSDEDETVLLSSASLKTLRINKSDCSGSFSFDTPSLVSLDYTDFVAEDYPLANFQNLLEAGLDLIVTEDQIVRARSPNNDWLEEYGEDDDVSLRFRNVAKLMNGIRNVQKLYLTSSTLEVLSLCCELMPVLNNIKLLGFWGGESRWQAVPVLLKNCPHLETLIIAGLLHRVTDTCGDVCDCIPHEEKGRSLTSCPIKSLEIQEFRGTRKEFHMIEHFLDYLPCLKKIEIVSEGYSPTQLDFLEVIELKLQILELYKKSLSCNVKIMLCESLYKKFTAQCHR